MKLKRSGNQWIRTDVLGVLAYAAFLLVLFAFYLLFACADGNRKKAKSGNDDDPREQVSAGSGLAGATQPGSVASASTDGRVPDHIHTIKESLLDRAVPGVYVTSDHGFDKGIRRHKDAPCVFLATNDPNVMRRGERADIAPTILEQFGVDLDKIDPPLDGHTLTKPYKPPMW